jgi:benzil reductase ((S)-benzoin forming)
MKTALITGGSSGLGRELAIELAGQGIKVFIVGRDDDKLAETTAISSDLIVPIKADLSNEEGRDKVFRTLIQPPNAIQYLDYLIHNAGTEQPLKAFGEIMLEEWRYAFSLNVDTSFSLTQKFLPYFKYDSRILFVSSGLAFQPMLGLSAYCSSKSAFSMLAECLKVELKPRGISVGIVLPGVINTGMQSRLRETEAQTPISGEFFRTLEPKLRPPKEVADFLKNILLKTETPVFRDTPWNINKPELNIGKFTA